MVESHGLQFLSLAVIRSLASDLNPPATRRRKRKESMLKYSETGPRLGRMSGTFSQQWLVEGFVTSFPAGRHRASLTKW